MRLFFLIISVSFLYITGLSQTNNNKTIVDDHNYLVGHNMSIPKYHHRVELEDLKKSSLTNIYIRRVRIYNELLPFLVLKAGPGRTLVSLHVPESKKNLKILGKHYKAKTKRLDALEKDLHQIVNFSDRETIIDAIMILEASIWQFQKFRGGDFHHEETH